MQAVDLAEERIIKGDRYLLFISVMILMRRTGT